MKNCRELTHEHKLRTDAPGAQSAEGMAEGRARTPPGRVARPRQLAPRQLQLRSRGAADDYHRKDLVRERPTGFYQIQPRPVSLHVVGQ